MDRDFIHKGNLGVRARLKIICSSNWLDVCDASFRCEFLVFVTESGSCVTGEPVKFTKSGSCVTGEPG